MHLAIIGEKVREREFSYYFLVLDEKMSASEKKNIFVFLSERR